MRERDHNAGEGQEIISQDIQRKAKKTSGETIQALVKYHTPIFV